MWIEPGPLNITIGVVAATRARAEGIAARQAAHLALLFEAAQGARFYRQALAGRPPRSTPLSALPVVGKAPLMKHFADLRIVARGAESRPLGRNGELKRVVAAPARTKPAR